MKRRESSDQSAIIECIKEKVQGPHDAENGGTSEPPLMDRARRQGMAHPIISSNLGER